MRLQFEKSLINGDPNLFPSGRIECFCWSESGNKMAVLSPSNRQVLLFDGQTLEKKEKFGLKSTSSNEDSSWVVTAIAFSPDNSRLAIGQSDCSIFVYRIGLQWGEKKSIVAKYALQSPVVGLVWVTSGLVFCTLDGRVKVIDSSNNRMFQLLMNPLPLASITESGNDQLLVSFLDGSVYWLPMPTQLGQETINSKLILQWPSVQFSICLLRNLNTACTGGSDGRLHFILLNQRLGSAGSVEVNDGRQTIDLQNEINCVTASPTGDLVLVSSGKRLLLFSAKDTSSSWSQVFSLRLETGSGSISRLLFSPDGSKVLCAGTNGSVELLKMSLRRRRLPGGQQVSYVGRSQIVIRNIAADQPSSTSLTMRSSYPITKVRVMGGGRFVVAWTSSTLLFGRLPFEGLEDEESEEEQPITAEIGWNRDRTGLRFCFDFEKAILLQYGGELHVVDWQSSELLASVRTQFFSPHLISVRLQERNSQRKILAYLLDARNICAIDLTTGQQMTLIQHDQSVDWLELNETGDKLLFRDRMLRLFLFKLEISQTLTSVISEEETNEQNIGKVMQMTTLLSGCGFVQWVPLSDVIVAQSRDQLHVFYDTESAQVQSLPPGTQAIGIQRHQGRSWVQFGNDRFPKFELNETLLEFDTALQDKDFKRAMEYLESSDQSGERPVLWRQLAEKAVQHNDLAVAERAYAAAGDLVKSQFAHRCINRPEDEPLLSGKFELFEQLNEFQHVIKTYQRLRMWPEAIAFAERSQQHEKAEQLRDEYAQHLNKTGQQYEAAMLAEQSGRPAEAVRRYLACNQLLAAARCLRRHSNDLQMTESIRQELLDRLQQSQFYEEAGELYELQLLRSLDDQQSLSAAVRCYEAGQHFEQCLRLARVHFPADVVRYERALGQQLIKQGQPAAAIGHLIEAGDTQQALEAALAANQLQRAAELAFALGESLGAEAGRKLAKRLASAQMLDNAVDVCLAVGLARDAVEMLNQHGQFSRAFQLASRHLQPDEVADMYRRMGKALESEGKLSEAEKLYTICGLPDQAIAMYKHAHQYEAMLRLVAQFHPQLLQETRLHLAKELEALGRPTEAEAQYVAAGEWKAAVQVHSQAKRWEDAYRLARAYGGQSSARQIAFLWARDCATPVEAMQLLGRLGQLNPVLEQAQEAGAFEFAAALAKQSPELRLKLGQVHQRWAAALEQQGRRTEAEKLYLEAGRPREAIAMRLHSCEFEQALKLAESMPRDSSLLREVCLAYIRSIVSGSGAGVLRKAAGTEPVAPEAENLLVQVEKLALRAARPEVAVNLLLEHQWPERAAKFAAAHAPHLHDAVRRSVRGPMNETQNIPSTPTTGSLSRVFNSVDDEQLSLQVLSDRLFQAARQGSREQLLAAAAALARGQQRLGRCEDALRTLQQHAAIFLLPDTWPLLIAIGQELFAMESGNEPSAEVWKLLRDALLAALNASSDPAAFGRSETEMLTSESQLKRHLLISHYLLLRSVLGTLQRLPAAAELHDKICVSLLRYTDLLRVDRTFFQAGVACLDCGKVSVSFVFLNHFLDLVDAIEQGVVELDHSQLEGTDIPTQVPLPSTIFCVRDVSTAYRFSGQPLSDGSKRQIQLEEGDDISDGSWFKGESLVEQVRAWILQKSMDAQEPFKLPLNKGDGRFEASLDDQQKKLPCMASGYPVLTNKSIELKPGMWAANKDDWNKLIMVTKMSANEQLKDCLHFIGRLCGSASLVSRLT